MPTKRPPSSVSRSSKAANEGSSSGRWPCLYRNHHDSILLQGELLARGIPYTVRSGLRFFEQAHIKDVLAHLRIVLNPRDEASWRRLLLLLAGHRCRQGRGDLSRTCRRAAGRSRRSNRPRRWRSLPPKSKGFFAGFVTDLTTAARDQTRSATRPPRSARS